MATVKKLSRGERLNPDDLEENQWEYYEIEDEDYAIGKQNGRLSIFKLSPMVPDIITQTDSDEFHQTSSPITIDGYFVGKLLTQDLIWINTVEDQVIKCYLDDEQYVEMVKSLSDLEFIRVYGIYSESPTHQGILTQITQIDRLDQQSETEEEIISEINEDPEIQEKIAQGKKDAENGDVVSWDELMQNLNQ